MILIHLFLEKNNMYNRMKNKKHSKIVKEYSKQKEHHLEKLASKMLKNDEKLQQLKGKNINPKFLNLF